MNRMYQESIYEGYLTKSPPQMNRKWQRRYFVLLPHQKLIYFSKYNGKQKGIIDLDRVQEILIDPFLDKGPSNVISLEVKGQQDDQPKARRAPDRIYYLLADSRELMEVWHKHLMEEADLLLCRENEVVADSTQGDEYNISARSRTAIAKEGADKRGLASSFNQDAAMAPEYGAYNRTVAELSQSTHVGESCGLYSSSNSQILLDISPSFGEESYTFEEEFTRPDSATMSTKSISPKCSVSANNTLVPPQKQLVFLASPLSLQSSPLSKADICPSFLPSHLLEEDTFPFLPARRMEQMFPQELNFFDLPLPPQRASSLKRLLPPRHPPPSPGSSLKRFFRPMLPQHSAPSPTLSSPPHGTALSQELTACQEYPKARVILVGDSGTGKTSLVIKLATGIFEPMCSPTIGIDFHLKLLSYPGSGLPDPGCLAVDIWDTAGQERFRSISTSYFKNISGVLLVFDLSNRKSFTNLESWIDYVHEHTTEDSFVLQLVGNKCDLERQVSPEEVSLFCSNKQLSYVETSSTDSELTNQLFHRLGEEIIKKGYYKGVPGDRSPPSRSLSVSSSVPLTTPRASCCGLRRHPTNP